MLGHTQQCLLLALYPGITASSGWDLHGMLGIEPGLVWCNANVLPTVLSIQLLWTDLNDSFVEISYSDLARRDNIG